jgi:RHS repeat-associated protein
MLSQLTGVVRTNISNSSNWSALYNYGKNGDMTGRTIQSSTTSFSYLGNQMKTASGGESFSLDYDLNGVSHLDDGNMKTLPTTDTNSLVYNWDGKLRSAQKGSNTINVRYDPAGNRIRKDSSVSGTRKYIVDTVGDLPVILMELNTSGNILKTYIYGNSQILAQHDGDHTTNKYFYLHDRLGSIRQVINSSGNIVNYYTYEPFGQTVESGGTLSNPFMFTGQYYDSEINLYYLRARNYHPHIGRFTSRDIVDGQFDNPLSLHKYLYCKNDPPNYVDPWGLDSVALYDGSDENGGYRFSWAALDFDWRFNVSSVKEAAFYLELLHDDYGVEIENVYFLDHGRKEKNVYYQEVGNELLRPRSSEWLQITATVANNGALHLRGCFVAAGDSGKQYIQQLANVGGRKVDAFDNVVNWSFFPYIGPNYYSEGGLWQATPGGKTPEEIWSGGGFWKRHW